MAAGAGIAAANPYPRQRVRVLDSEMAFLEQGSGAPIVLLHGNPTSSFLWRNVLPHLEGLGRCLAPDLIGMGRSSRAPSGSYRFLDHARYLDAWFKAVGIARGVVLVGHDWGGVLAFHWAKRHPESVRGIAYMETFVRALTWDEWPEKARGIFQAMRSERGEELVLEKNAFVERILPASVLRTLSAEEMEAYRAPFMEAGEGRRPTLSWPREIPIRGEGPADMVALVDDCGRWLEQSPIPKLLVNADPGAILVGAQRDYCRSFPNQTEVTVRGNHFLQEDSPDEIGDALAAFIRHLARTA